MAATAARTDIHRPSAPDFNPDDYEFTGAIFDLGRHEDGRVNRSDRRIRSLLLREGYTEDDGVAASRCTHCGARLRYSALMIHKPTRSLIYIGETCLDGRFSDTQEGFRRRRREAQADRVAQRKLASFLAECDKHPVLTYASYGDNIAAASEKCEYWHKTLTIVRDIADCARNGKPVSDKQVALLGKLMGDLDAQYRKHLARKAKWAAEAAARVDAFIGEIGDRRLLTGTVRVCLERETDYGPATLLILDTPEGTVKWWASGARDYEQGEEITVKATVKAHEFDQRDGLAVTVITRGVVQK